MGVRRFLTVALFVSGIALVTGQDLPSVDPETAKLQIEQFENENRDLRAKIAKLAESNETLNVDIERWTRWINGIEAVRERLDEQVEQLRDALQNVGSRSVLERAQNALDRFATLDSLLESKRDELSTRIDEAQETLSTNRSTISLYRTRVEQNQENIELLNAAIAQSQDSEQLINGYLESLDSIMQEARDLLESPDTE